MKLFVRSSGARRDSIELGERIGGGGAGDVYRIEGRPGEVAKIYKTKRGRDAYEKKIEAMLAAPASLDPIKKGSRVLHQLAWPTLILEDRQRNFLGFVMPEIDFDAALSLERLLQKRSRANSGIPEAYGHRVVTAYNAAFLVARLHEKGHHVVDLKPINALFYRENMQLVLVDCDGFSILGTDRARYPAEQFTTGYIAPEFLKRKPKGLGEEQDRFALAVIVFRLLNNGLHPYQGRPLQGPGASAGSTLEENLAAGLYAYGQALDPRLGPAVASIHESFSQELRDLFDRAFGKPGGRPSAQEWQNVLYKYADPKRGGLKKCAKNPEEHAHFGQGCGLCALEARISRPIKSRPTRASPKARRGRSPRASPQPQRPGVVPLAPMVRARGGRWFLAAVVAAIVSLIWSNSIDGSAVESDLAALVDRSAFRKQAAELADQGRSSSDDRDSGIADLILDGLGIDRARPSRADASVQGRSPALLKTSSGAPLSRLERRCVEMNVEAGKMSSGAAADYCYDYYSEQRGPATRQIENVLSVRGLGDISVREQRGMVRVSGTLGRRKDFETLTNLLAAVGLSQIDCDVTSLTHTASGRISHEVRCDAAAGSAGRSSSSLHLVR